MTYAVLRSELDRIEADLTRLTARASELRHAEQVSRTPHVRSLCRRIVRERRLRERFFDVELFADPAWDILLDLYIAEQEDAQVSVSSLCIAAAVPGTTGLRWIQRMEAAGLIERRPDPFDKRRRFMSLSKDARGRMRDYLEELMANPHSCHLETDVGACEPAGVG